MPNKEEIIKAIKQCAKKLGHPPSRSQFKTQTRISEYHIMKHFSSWSEAVRRAGLAPDMSNVRLDDKALLEDWGLLVRKMRQIPTRSQYLMKGRYTFRPFDTHFGPWSTIPDKFRKFAKGKPEWADVLALLPVKQPKKSARRKNLSKTFFNLESVSTTAASGVIYEKMSDRLVYGNYLDFRGLRHEPVNEAGVTFLFGMVAKELGYSVEAMQAGFPDCEAKRQIGPGKWQRVRIEFEFESRTFHNHRHDPNGCDIIVCWRHNWPDSPDNLEIVELSSVIKALPKSDI